MQLTTVLTSGMATCTAALLALVLRGVVRGERPSLAILLQTLGALLMTIALYQEATHRAARLDVVDGLVPMTFGLLLGARRRARRKQQLH